MPYTKLKRNGFKWSSFKTAGFERQTLLVPLLKFKGKSGYLAFDRFSQDQVQNEPGSNLVNCQILAAILDFQPVHQPSVSLTGFEDGSSIGVLDE